jgi:hypothetical protein
MLVVVSRYIYYKWQALLLSWLLVTFDSTVS